MDAIGDVMRRCRLSWHGQVERKGDATWVKPCCKLVVEGTVPAGSRQNKTWHNTVCVGMRLMGIVPGNIQEHKVTFRARGQWKVNPTVSGTLPYNQ